MKGRILKCCKIPIKTEIKRLEAARLRKTALILYSRFRQIRTLRLHLRMKAAFKNAGNRINNNQAKLRV